MEIWGGTMMANKPSTRPLRETEFLHVAMQGSVLRGRRGNAQVSKYNITKRDLL